MNVPNFKQSQLFKSHYVTKSFLTISYIMLFSRNVLYTLLCQSPNQIITSCTTYSYFGVIR